MAQFFEPLSIFTSEFFGNWGSKYTEMLKCNNWLLNHCVILKKRIKMISGLHLTGLRKHPVISVVHML